MKNFVLLIALFVSSISFGQKLIDLNEKQAFEKWKSSNIRENLMYEVKEFNYKNLVKEAKKLKVPLSKMIILNSSKDEIFIEHLAFRHSISSASTGENIIYCERCNNIPYQNIEKKYKNFNKGR